MSEVELRNVQKVYPNGFNAIQGIDIRIEHGEFVVLVGPSGCGKSTLLRMVAGLETVSDGDVSIADRIVNELEPSERDIAMVFQNYALYPHMTCYGNMSYGLRNRGTPKPEIERRVRDAARILEIEPLLDRKPRQLSGGQRQRVAMGRAIVREPTVFLFDEPLSNLDAKLRVQMRLEIKRLQRRLGTTSLYVTHDQVEAMTMADRLVVMNAGRAEQIGTPLEVYSRPRTQFVASFIGSPAMNFIDGEIATGGSEVSLPGGNRLGVPSGAAAPAGAIVVGVRPEHLTVHDQGDLTIDVELSEPLGAETLVHGRLHHADSLVTVRLAGEQLFASGEVLHCSVAPDRLHLFHPESGLRLG